MKRKSLLIILQRTMLWVLFFAAICLPAAHSQWTVEPMPNQHLQFTAAALGDKVFFGPGNSFAGFHTHVDVYNVSSGEWEYVLEVSVPRANPTGIAAEGRVYFAGGLSQSWLDPIMLDVVDIYDTLSGEWTTAVLSEARSELKAVQAGDKLLFAGGISNLVGDFVTSPTVITTSSVVDIYDLTNHEWSSTSLSLPRVGIASAAIGDIAIFAGGQTASGTVTDTVDIYDAATGDWTVARLSEAKGWCSAEALGGKIYIAGGSTADFEVTDKIEILDLETMTWDSALLSQARAGMRSAALGEKIFFAGGGPYDLTHYLWTQPFLKRVDIYDAVTNKWTEDNLQNGHVVHAAAAAGNKFLVAGGGPQPGLVEIFTDLTFTDVKEQLLDATVSVFPNPVSNQLVLEIQSDKKDLFHVQLFDLKGRLLQSFELPVETTASVNLEHLSSGAYLLKIFNENGMITKKVIKE